MTEEIRHEQDHSMQVEKARKLMENQVKELQVRLEEAEGQAMKGGRKLIQKLEQRVSGLVVILEHVLTKKILIATPQIKIKFMI